MKKIYKGFELIKAIKQLDRKIDIRLSKQEKEILQDYSERR